ncbi:MAG: hypothetical protein N3E50_02180 [Candidatus Goldbacteria bacterium]|nr:hypothetical protein [Candidatus Goldiibacteriota bacterium]
MDASYLLEIITTWRDIYESISISVDKERSKEDEEFHKKWNVGMLKVIAALELIDDIAGSPVEKHFVRAIENARTKDIKKLDDIYVLLGEVEDYLKKSKDVIIDGI